MAVIMFFRTCTFTKYTRLMFSPYNCFMRECFLANKKQNKYTYFP